MMTSGRIPQNILNDLLDRTDLVALVGRYVQLSNKGKNHLGRCPFHDEKTPSFTVSPTKQFYHCFGCGAHGNAISFLMEHQKQSFIEAVESLASDAGISLPTTPGKSTSYQNDYVLMSQAAKFYESQLRTSTIAIEYLKKRGLTGEIAKTYGLGYAPAAWESLLQHCGKSEEQALIKLGMAISKETGSPTYNRVYDRFRDRIIFPIRDTRGRVVGFGGRVLDPEQIPKYLNSPETPIYHKGQELYGLYEALQHRPLNHLLLVEGYMDVIALAQHGVHCAVASLGTSATVTQLELAFRHTNTLIFCFDGDTAGQEAAKRALEHVLPLLEDGREAKFLFLPENQDPDDTIRHEGQAAFLKRLEKALPLSAFFFQRLRDDIPLTSHDSRARFAKTALPLIQRLPEGFFRQMLMAELSKQVGLDVESFQEKKPTTQTERRQPFNNLTKLKARSPLRQALALLLNAPELAEQVTDLASLKTLTAPGIDLLVELIELLHTSPHLKTGTILEHWRGRSEEEILARLASQEVVLLENNVIAEFNDALLRLLQHSQELRMEELLAKAGYSELEDAEKRELQALIQRCKIRVGG